MVGEAIILAGGLGTRLRETFPGPKCMAPVAGEPFLSHVIRYWRSQGVSRFIFSLGYQHEIVEDYLREKFPTLDYVCVVEKEPLGTGGAISLALREVLGPFVWIANGDTLFTINSASQYQLHRKQNAECSVALKPMRNFDRYGTVTLDHQNRITRFTEKKFYTEGLINGGIYLVTTNEFRKRQFPEKYSFETDFLEKYAGSLTGYPDDAYFIDIGVPGDYARAREELSKPSFDLAAIDNSWTLFLDRDGVINHEKKGDYIRNASEFRFYTGVRESFHLLNEKFGKIIVVTNQRGIGRGLMTEEDLFDVHEHMKAGISSAGGRIDAILYCTNIDNKFPYRKPNPGMAYEARLLFPSIDMTRSVVVGNKLSDMGFGRNAGMYTVFAATTHPETPFPHPDIDFRVDSLPDFAKALKTR